MLVTTLLHFVAAIIPVVVAGDVLARCADTIAAKTGLGRLLVGSVFLAAATSLPELMVDISAVRMGQIDLAAGDLLGSSLFNLLILAVADLMTQGRGRMLSRASAAHALAATVSIFLTAFVAIAIQLGSHVGTISFGGIGLASVMLFIAYAFGLRLVYYAQSQAAGRDPDPPSSGGGSLRLAIPGFLLSTGVIFVAAPFVARSAAELADLSGLGGTFIGTTLVAFSTSLPELVATLSAVRLKAFDLAVGNIFGSNAFNMLLFAPLDMAHGSPLFAGIAQTHTLTALAVILATAIAVLGQLYSVERRIRFIEPDASLVIAIIVGTLALLYYMR